MNRILLVVVVLAGAGVLAGCGRVFDEGMGAALGAKANVVDTQSPSLDRGTPLGPVSVDKIDNGFGKPVTGDWLIALSTSLRDRLARDRDLNEPGRRAVRISGQVIHLEGSTLMDQAFGPHPEVIVRVTATDASSGQVIGVANILGRGRGGETSAGQGKLCAAFAEGVDKWLHTADRPRR